MHLGFPGGVVDFLEIGGVLDREPGGRGEIAERVVARGVAAGAPADIGALLLQPVDAAHHVVDAQHVIGDMVEAGRPGQQRDAVMPLVAAQEAHEIAQPVADLEAQHIGEEADHFLVVGRVQHDMADLLRDAFPAGQFARGAAGDIGRNLERQAVLAEEAEAIAAAQRIELLRREHDLAAIVGDLGVQRIDIFAAVCGQRDDVDPLRVRRAQTHDIELVIALGCEVQHSVLLACVLQAPDVAIEGGLGGQIGHGIADMANFVDTCHNGNSLI